MPRDRQPLPCNLQALTHLLRKLMPLQPSMQATERMAMEMAMSMLAAVSPCRALTTIFLLRWQHEVARHKP
jgi:hypothetical protein